MLRVIFASLHLLVLVIFLYSKLGTIEFGKIFLTLDSNYQKLKFDTI